MYSNEVKTCRYGQMIYNKQDKYVGRSLDIYGEYSEGEVGLFRQIVTGGMYVLDIGANIGAHTVAFSGLIGPDGRVLAFEPQRIVFQMLAGNMAINSIQNAYCHQKAVGEKPGVLKVPNIDYGQTSNWGAVPVGDWKDGETVEVVTIDELGLPGCHFMKVDVEGMELSALKGAEKTIGTFRPFLYLENDRLDTSQDIITYVDSLNYDMYWHCPPLFNPNNYAGNRENVFGDTCSINMICIPRELDVKMKGFKKIAF